jgi:hypothetical protein
MEHELTYEDLYVKVPVLYKIVKMELNSFRPKIYVF